MARRRKPDPVVSALAAKTMIEGRAGKQPAGMVEEDGSYLTRDGRTYDPETGRYRARKRVPEQAVFAAKTYRA
jgi:hypothetical protein